MSNPRNYWFFTAKKMCQRYRQLKRYTGLQEILWFNAIEKTWKETGKLEKGSERQLVIQKVLFDKTDTVLGMTYKVGYCERVLWQWVNDFINTVGKNAGFN